uniref:Uncharacterized protein n=1 Tax=Steinernema glaseri TaxID=37863 RepID=A0A1I7Y7L3_9BILA
MSATTALITVPSGPPLGPCARLTTGAVATSQRGLDLKREDGLAFNGITSKYREQACFCLRGTLYNNHINVAQPKIK